MLTCNFWEFKVLHSDDEDATKLTHNVEDWECSTSNKSYSRYKLTPKTSLPFKDFSLDNTSWNSCLKFMLFCGILSLQDSQNAFAVGSDVANLMQSNSFFGDLSDLSTGFASVSIINLPISVFFSL